MTWLKETYKAEIVAFCADVGQEEELTGLKEKALKTGASKCYIELLVQVFDVALARAGLERLLLQPRELLLLPDIGAERDDLGLVGFLEPGHQHRSEERRVG